MSDFQPAAFGIGVSQNSPDDVALDTRFLVTNHQENFTAGARIAQFVGHTHGSGTYELNSKVINDIIASFGDVAGGPSAHPNLAALEQIGRALDSDVLTEKTAVGMRRKAVVVLSESLDSPCVDSPEVYLRLHLMSQRKALPNSMNLEGIFDQLSNVVWTNQGPFDLASWSHVHSALALSGEHLTVHGIDKFPRMVDYVIPPGVRIADANRVRLGAHLSEGTTVMHEGFVNFNAGTLGPAMVEGRISAGVVVGEHSDIGGGASLMGTLSGGGLQRVSVGKHCLIGANAGLGIAVGDNCVVEAGLYVTAGSLVQLPDGTTIKARELSGQSDLMFLRHSITGTMLVRPRGDTWNQGLNASLHLNT